MSTPAPPRVVRKLLVLVAAVFLATTLAEPSARAQFRTPWGSEVPVVRPPAPRVEPLYPKWAGVAIVGGVYSAVYTWTYFAWYKNRSTIDHIVWNPEGLFEADTYAGGSDKLGHMWGNYIINRWTANILDGAGWREVPSAIISTSTTMAFFTMIEVKDGYHKGFGFSWWDMAFNMAGNALAAGMILSPKLDDMFDFKVYYLPTTLYLRSLKNEGVVDAGEDYSGQTFVVAYHLNSIPIVAKDSGLEPLRYLDLYVGYRSLNYLPTPQGAATDRKQELSFGVAFNVQHLLDVAFDRYERPRTHVHSSSRFFLEGFGVPYTNTHLIRYQRNNGPGPPDDGEIGH
jgi:hypothetical protein